MDRPPCSPLPGFPDTGDTLGEALDAAVERWPQEVFVSAASGPISYEQFSLLVDQQAQALLLAGVSRGDSVATMMGNGVDYLAAWFAAARIGALEVPVNTAFKGESLRYVLSHSDARVLICHTAYLPAIEPELAELRDLKHLIMPDTTEPPDLPGQVSSHGIDELHTLTGGRPPWSVFAKDPVQIAYTSGTTGRSKGVLIPHKRVMETARDQIRLRGIEASDVLYTPLPLFHGNARYLTVLPGLLSGAEVALGSRFSASKFWDEVRGRRATQFNYLGVMLAILNRNPPEPDDGDHELRLAWGAGATHEVAKAFEERFKVPLVEGYGLTESGIVLSNTVMERKRGSCGKAVDGYDVQLVDADDNPVPVGSVGEVVIRPQRPYTTMLGYHKMPSATVEAFRNLFVHTGDLARMDRDGFFYFVDRSKDAIRRRGENISSQEIEAAVDAHPDVAESAAIPVPSELTEQDVMIVIHPRPGAPYDLAAIIEHCESVMPYYWVPRYYRLSPEPLPRTSTNKIEKHKLKTVDLAGAWDKETESWCGGSSSIVGEHPATVT